MAEIKQSKVLLNEDTNERMKSKINQYTIVNHSNKLKDKQTK